MQKHVDAAFAAVKVRSRSFGHSGARPNVALRNERTTGADSNSVRQPSLSSDPNDQHPP